VNSPITDKKNNKIIVQNNQATRRKWVIKRIKLHVLLKNNTNEDVCDFNVEANFYDNSCVVCAGQYSSQVSKVQLIGHERMYHACEY
jgi:hypothetical protein